MMLEIYVCSKINGCSVFIFRQFFTGQFFLKFAVTKLIDYESLKNKNVTAAMTLLYGKSFFSTNLE